MGNKRAKDLTDAISKSGAYILVDKAGWPESLKFPANLLALLTDLSAYLNKTSDLISQVDAEAGVSNTAQSFSSLRVRQNVEAWWLTIAGTEKPLFFEQESDKNANFTYTIPGNSKLEGIDFNYISGTPVIKVGTTNGGDEVLEERVVGATGNCNLYQNVFASDTLLYVSVSGGTVDVMLYYRKQYWS